MQLTWVRCKECGLQFVEEDRLEGAAVIPWSSWVIPRRVTTGHTASVVSAVIGDDAEETRRPYRRHVLALADRLGLTRSESGVTSCQGCGAHKSAYTSAATF